MISQGVGGYGQFGALSRVELERFFHLDDEDWRLISLRRSDYNRLGFALQVATVRHLGMFLTDPLDVRRSCWTISPSSWRSPTRRV